MILDSGSVASLTGGDEQPKGTGDLPASMQTLLPMYMGRYNAFQSSGEDSRSPLGLPSGTESDTSDASEVYRTWSSQIVKNVLKGISDKLSVRNSRESRNEESSGQNDGMMERTSNGCLEKNPSFQQVQVQIPAKVEAASHNVEHNMKDDSLNLNTANSREVCENAQRCKMETFQEPSGTSQRQKQWDHSHVTKSSEDVESGYPEKTKEKRRKKRRGQMPSYNREALSPEHNHPYDSSESDSKFNEVESTVLNSIETKPLVHKSPTKGSDNELGYITEGINGSGTGKSSSPVINDHGECTKEPSSTSRIIPIELRQAEGRSSLQPLTSAQAKRQVEEFDAFKELLAMNAESSSSDVCDIRATRKEELRNICNPTFGSWTGKSYAKRSYTRRSNRVPVRKSGKAHSLSSSSIGKSDDPEFCKSIWTAKEFVIGDRNYDNMGNFSNPIRFAAILKSDADLQRVALEYPTNKGARQFEHMQKSAINQGVAESIVQSAPQWKRSTLRKEGLMPFDLAPAGNQESSTQNKTVASSYKYFYYEPEDLVFAREFSGSAGHGRDFQGAKRSI